MVLRCAPRLELLLVLALDDTKSLSSSHGSSSHMGMSQNENTPPTRNVHLKGKRCETL